MTKNNSRLTIADYFIELGDLEDSSFSKLLSQCYKQSKILILVDENTQEFCLPYLLSTFEELNRAEVIVLPAGEENKCLSICEQIWGAMIDYQISRKDLIINLGGGVTTDMGGFIASLYKRGIDFINLPTSLLAMVDASIGGKTGVDLENYKNVIGVFSNPKAVYIDLAFLGTLPLKEKIGGWIEMLKHGLIRNQNHWIELTQIDVRQEPIPIEFILNSLRIKEKVVMEDPREENLRKILNFGHTFGHAVEACFLELGSPINHGIAVASGIVVESFWSYEKKLLSREELDEITSYLVQLDCLPDISAISVEDLWRYAKNDKKNDQDKVMSILLKKIGDSQYNEEISEEMFVKGIRYYLELTQ